MYILQTLSELFCNILCRLFYVDFTKILCSFVLQRLYEDFVLLDLQTFFLLTFLQRIYGDFTEISAYAIKSL